MLAKRGGKARSNQSIDFDDAQRKEEEEKKKKEESATSALVSLGEEASQRQELEAEKEFLAMLGPASPGPLTEQQEYAMLEKEVACASREAAKVRARSAEETEDGSEAKETQDAVAAAEAVPFSKNDAFETELLAFAESCMQKRQARALGCRTDPPVRPIVVCESGLRAPQAVN